MSSDKSIKMKNKRLIYQKHNMINNNISKVKVEKDRAHWKNLQTFQTTIKYSKYFQGKYVITFVINLHI